MGSNMVLACLCCLSACVASTEDADEGQRRPEATRVKALVWMQVACPVIKLIKSSIWQYHLCLVPSGVGGVEEENPI